MANLKDKLRIGKQQTKQVNAHNCLGWKEKEKNETKNKKEIGKIKKKQTKQTKQRLHLLKCKKSVPVSKWNVASKQ